MNRKFFVAFAVIALLAGFLLVSGGVQAHSYLY